MNEQQALKYLTTVFKSLSAIIIANKFIALALVLIGLIAQWIVFVKAGRKGWETLIPIYKDVIAIQTFWGIGKIVRTFIFTLVAIILLYVGTTTMNRTVFIIGFGCFIPLVLFYPTYVYKKARFFNQGFWFGVGLFFLPYIFNIVIAIDKNCRHSTY